MEKKIFIVVSHDGEVFGAYPTLDAAQKRMIKEVRAMFEQRPGCFKDDSPVTLCLDYELSTADDIIETWNDSWDHVSMRLCVKDCTLYEE